MSNYGEGWWTTLDATPTALGAIHFDEVARRHRAYCNAKKPLDDLASQRWQTLKGANALGACFDAICEEHERTADIQEKAQSECDAAAVALRDLPWPTVEWSDGPPLMLVWNRYVAARAALNAFPAEPPPGAARRHVAQWRELDRAVSVAWTNVLACDPMEWR